MSTTNGTMGRFDVGAIAASLPETSATLLADHYLTDRPSGSARVFRVYRPVPAHYHRGCDEYLYVLSGRGTFWMGDASNAAAFGPGQLLVFDRGTVHAMPELHEHPVTFLSIDTPRREPTDVVFVDPEAASSESFMARNAGLGSGA